MFESLSINKLRARIRETKTYIRTATHCPMMGSVFDPENTLKHLEAELKNRTKCKGG